MVSASSKAAAISVREGTFLELDSPSMRKSHIGWRCWPLRMLDKPWWGGGWGGEGGGFFVLTFLLTQKNMSSLSQAGNGSLC